MASTLVNLAGAQQIAGARALQRERERQVKWPFPWVERPPGSKHVYAQGSIAAPATSAVTLVVTYTTPNNFLFCLDGLVLSYSPDAGASNAWVPGDGAAATFSVLINNASGATNSVQGRPFKDYGTVTTPLGSPVQGFWPVNPGENSILRSKDTLTAFITIDPAIITNGRFLAIFNGWEWPE